MQQHGTTVEKNEGDKVSVMTILVYLHSFQMKAQRHEPCNHTTEKGSVA
jgi:hypothetical protein